MKTAAVGFSIFHRNVGRFQSLVFFFTEKKNETEIEHFSVGSSVKPAKKAGDNIPKDSACMSACMCWCLRACLNPPPKSIGTRRMGYYLPDNFGADWLWKSNTLVPGTVDSVQPVRNSGYPIPFFDFVFGGQPKNRRNRVGFRSRKTTKTAFRFSVHNPDCCCCLHARRAFFRVFVGYLNEKKLLKMYFQQRLSYS